MSGFKKILQKLTSDDLKNEGSIVPPKNTIVGFNHGPYVTLISGVHKGVGGFVTDFHSGKYVMSVFENDYVPKSQYILNNKLDQEIIGEIPILYRLNLSELPQTVLDVPSPFITEVVVYKVGPMLQVGNLVSTSPGSVTVKKINLENDDLSMMLSDLNLKDSRQLTLPDLDSLHISDKNVHAPVELLEKLSMKIKQGSDLQHIFDNEIVEVALTDLFGQYFIVYQGDANTIGKFGILSDIFEEQYIIRKKSTSFTIAQPQIQKDGDFVKIVKGKFKSDKLFGPDEYVYCPPHLTITLNTNGRRVTDSAYNVGTPSEPRFVTRKITPKDVFYSDIKIKDAYGQVSVAQVQKVDIHSGTFDAILKAGSPAIKNIRFSDVVSLEPGFQWKYGSVAEGSEYLHKSEEEVTEEVSIVTEETGDDDNESLDGKENDYGDDNDDNNEDDDDNGIVMQQEPEMKETFSDKDRLYTTETKMTTEQQFIKNNILKTLKNANINEESLDIHSSTINLEQLFATLQKKFGMTIFNTTDGKYITAAAIFGDLVRAGFRNVDKHFGFLAYTDLLVSPTSSQGNKHLKFDDVTKNNNINQLLLLKKSSHILSDTDFTKQNKEVKNLLQQNKIQDILKVLMANALILVNKISGLDVAEEPNSFSLGNLIPIGRHNPNAEKYLQAETSYVSKGKQHTIQHYGSLPEYVPTYNEMITIEDFALNKKVPVSETRILWGADVQGLLQETKNTLLELAENDSGAAGPDYQFIVDNIERGPYAIRELPDSDLKNYFKHVFKQLLVSAIKMKRRTQKTKEKRRRNLEDDRDYRKKKREDVTNHNAVDDEEQDVQVLNTNSYEKEARIREMKKIVANGSRLRFKKATTEDATKDSTEDTTTDLPSDQDQAWRALTEASSEQ